MNAFSLKITSKDGDSFIFERSQIVCNHRAKIISLIIRLNGRMINDYEASLPNRHAFEKLMQFITTLEGNSFVITLQNSKTIIALYRKTNKMQDCWKEIQQSAIDYGGNETYEGFDFNDTLSAYLFIETLSDKYSVENQI